MYIHYFITTDQLVIALHVAIMCVIVSHLLAESLAKCGAVWRNKVSEFPFL